MLDRKESKQSSSGQMGVLNLLFMLYFNGTVKPLIKRKVTAMTIIDNACVAENDTFLCNQEKVTSH